MSEGAEGRVEIGAVKRAVVWHEHFFPPTYDGSSDDADDVTGRFDALEYDDGTFAVWSAETRSDVEIVGSREEAIAGARERSGRDSEVDGPRPG